MSFTPRFFTPALVGGLLGVTLIGSLAYAVVGMSASHQLTAGETESARREGRKAAALVAGKDAFALYRRFTPSMAAQVPQSLIEKTFATLLTTDGGGAPLGERLEETVKAGPQAGTTLYVTSYRWKPGQNLTLTILFVGDSKAIGSMLLRPEQRATLPPDPRADYRLKAILHLPFAPGDEWTVGWGGDTRAQNYHVDYSDQRHAFDLLVVKNGVTHEGDGTRLSQYYAYGRRIVAPAAGTVVEAVNTLPDNPPGKQDPAHAAGNHVLLNLGNGEYALLAHLQPGSVRVKAGDKVSTGQLLGLCGNSGNTSEPHLHFHVQDKPYLFRDAIGLPVTFLDYVSEGKKVVRGLPVRGETIHTTAFVSALPLGKEKQ